MAQQTTRILEAEGGTITLDVLADTVSNSVVNVHGVNASGGPCKLTITDMTLNRTVTRTFAAGANGTWTPPAGSVPWGDGGRPLRIEVG